MATRQDLADLRDGFLVGLLTPAVVASHAYTRARQALGKEPTTPFAHSPRTSTEDHRERLKLRLHDEVRVENAHVTAAYITGLAIGLVAPAGIAGSIAVHLYKRTRTESYETHSITTPPAKGI